MRYNLASRIKYLSGSSGPGPHARQHLHLRQSAAPVQVSVGVPMLAQGAPLRFASGTSFGRCARSRLS
jgi:hypothetical protein